MEKLLIDNAYLDFFEALFTRPEHRLWAKLELEAELREKQQKMIDNREQKD